MVDIEAEIFDRLYTAVTTAFPTCSVVGEDLPEEPKFPIVSVEMTQNSTNTSTLDSAGEHHSNITFKVEVFTNDRTGKKAKAKSILNTIDESMTALNFIRTTANPQFMKYASVYRYITHYSATVSTDGTIYYRR